MLTRRTSAEGDLERDPFESSYSSDEDSSSNQDASESQGTVNDGASIASSHSSITAAAAADRQQQVSSSGFSSYYSVSPHPVLNTDGALSFSTATSHSESAPNDNDDRSVDRSANHAVVPSILGGLPSSLGGSEESSMSYLSVTPSMISSSFLSEADSSASSPTLATASDEGDDMSLYSSTDSSHEHDCHGRSTFETVGSQLLTSPPKKGGSIPTPASKSTAAATEERSAASESTTTTKDKSIDVNKWLQVGAAVVGVVGFVLLAFSGNGNRIKLNGNATKRKGLASDW